MERKGEARRGPRARTALAGAAGGAGLAALALALLLAACGGARPVERRPAPVEEEAEEVTPPPAAPPLAHCEGVELPRPPAAPVLPGDQAEAQALEAEAWQVLARGDPSAALEVAREAAAKDPWSFRARMAEGVVLSRLGGHRAALTAFCAARALDESSTKALYWIGYTRVELGEVAAGIATIRTLLEWDPESKDAWYELGYALSRSGDAEKVGEALHALDRAVALGQDDGRVHYERGYLLLRLERHAEAAAAYAAAAKKRPGHAPTRRELAAALAALDRHADAEKEARKAIRLDDTHPDGHYWLGRALLARGRCDKAQRAFLDAVHVAPDGLKERYQRWVEQTKETCRR
jgi:tetratricopeptide (TPR) repeat protein